MDPERFIDDSLVLVGHGSTENADSSAPVFQHATELRRRRLFGEVHEAFWKQPPLVTEILARVQSRRVFILPFFISDGYFSEVAVPRALGFEGGENWNRVRVEGGRSWVYCRAVGSHESMTGVLLARAQQAVEQAPFPRAPRPSETTLFIAGHGTRQNDNSRKAIERQVELISALKLYAAVHPCFLEESPAIGDCYELALTRCLVMVPFFISDGLHVREDIPVLLGEPERIVRARLQNGQATWRNPTERKGKLVWYSRGIGTEPLLSEVILERVREAAGRWNAAG